MPHDTEGREESPPYRFAPWGTFARGTRLFADFLKKDGNVDAFFGPSFDDSSALERLAARLQARSYERNALVHALTGFAGAVGAPGGAREQLELLGRSDSLVVFSAHQAGLFTGPLYTIYKALTVERWAAELSRLLSVPVIACHWLASDDHDFNEVDHLCVPSGTDLSTIRYVPDKPHSGEPVGRLYVDSGIERVMQELANTLPVSEFTESIFRALRESYAVGTRFPEAFARLWYRMFPQSRLLFVSPTEGCLKKLAAPLLATALADDDRLFAMYDEASTQLRALGYHAQVHKTSEQTFLFYQRSRRRSIRRDSNKLFVLGAGRTVTANELSDLITQHPDDFSPNVLLRPIMQNSLFPTLGVVLGPAETAYYAQIGTLHDYFDVPRPAVLPRTSLTFIERRVLGQLTRHGVDLESLAKNPELEVARVLRARLPQDLEIGFQVAISKVETAFDSILRDVERIDPALRRTVRASARRACHEVRRVASKTCAAYSRRERETPERIRSLALQLFPKGESQERTFNVIWYWARYGPRFLSELYGLWPSAGRNHVLWDLE